MRLGRCEGRGALPYVLCMSMCGLVAQQTFRLVKAGLNNSYISYIINAALINTSVSFLV